MKPDQLAIGVLAGGCALLALIWALLLGGVGQEIVPADALERPDLSGADGLAGEEFALPPLDTYAAVTARPLFSEDRKPVPPSAQDEGPADGEEDNQEATELDVTVTGIIITPEKKVAMVVDNATKEPMRLSEGMPLGGEQSAWTLTRIEPRKLVFDGGGGRPQEVELETYTRALQGGSPARARATPVATQSQAQAAEEKTDANVSVSEEDRAARAEEIRRRVAERRAQLREEAARRREEQQQENDNE